MTGEIRDLRAADLERVLEINEANTPAVSSIDAARLAFIVDESVIAIGAVDVDDLVGFVLVLGPGSSYDSVNYRWFMDRYNDAMYLDRVATVASHRGLGLGRRMYESVLDRIRVQHPHIYTLGLEVNVDPPNPGSMAFHRRLGFEEVGRQRTPYGAEVALMTTKVQEGRS